MYNIAYEYVESLRNTATNEREEAVADAVEDGYILSGDIPAGLKYIPAGDARSSCGYANRTKWHGFKLDYVADEPFWKSLLKYRAYKDRRLARSEEDANLISSHTDILEKTHLPVIDLDMPHRYVETSPGHAHLYLETETKRWRMIILLIGLYLTGNIEKGFFYWSLRRGGTFVRPEGVKKETPQKITTEGELS